MYCTPKNNWEHDIDGAIAVKPIPSLSTYKNTEYLSSDELTKYLTYSGADFTTRSSSRPHLAVETISAAFQPFLFDKLNMYPILTDLNHFFCRSILNSSKFCTRVSPMSIWTSTDSLLLALCPLGGLRSPGIIFWPSECKWIHVWCTCMCIIWIGLMWDHVRQSMWV